MSEFPIEGPLTLDFEFLLAGESDPTQGVVSVLHDPCDFNSDGVLDEHDAFILSAQIRIAAISMSLVGQRFDVTGDGIVDVKDLHFFIRDESKLHTWLGDRNLDGVFDEFDLIIMQLYMDRYENPIQDANWVSGDVNGDGLFTSEDITLIFQDGGYNGGPRTEQELAALAVPPDPSPAPIDNGVALVYDPETGSLAVSVDDNLAVTALQIVSQSGLFVDTLGMNLEGTWDVLRSDKLFKLVELGFGDVDLGTVLPSGLSGAQLLADLIIDGALLGGGDLAAAGVNPVLVHPDFLSGDFNGDGTVDGRDFLAWQRGGSPNPLSSDDLVLWQANYEAAGLLLDLASMPEPTTAMLLLCGALIGLFSPT